MLKNKEHEEENMSLLRKLFGRKKRCAPTVFIKRANCKLATDHTHVFGPEEPLNFEDLLDLNYEAYDLRTNKIKTISGKFIRSLKIDLGKYGVHGIALIYGEGGLHEVGWAHITHSWSDDIVEKCLDNSIYDWVLTIGVNN
jgi:hypothetical protein